MVVNIWAKVRISEQKTKQIWIFLSKKKEIVPNSQLRTRDYCQYCQTLPCMGRSMFGLVSHLLLRIVHINSLLYFRIRIILDSACCKCQRGNEQAHQEKYFFHNATYLVITFLLFLM